MKKYTFVLKLSAFLLLFTAFQCDTTEVSATCEQKVTQLDNMRVTIQNLANTSICNENFECHYIAFGSKACGGPMSYLVYSTSIDVAQLTKLVKEYNELETVLNIECERVSDCAMVNPPQRLECENNTCIAIY